MQNKANFRNARMNENLFAAKDYENEISFRLRKYKPNQSQFQNRNQSSEFCFLPSVLCPEDEWFD